MAVAPSDGSRRPGHRHLGSPVTPQDPRRWGGGGPVRFPAATMAGMPIPARRLLPLVLTGVLGASVAACGAYPPSAGASPRATATGTAPASTTTGPSSPEATEDLTPVPGGVS